MNKFVIIFGVVISFMVMKKKDVFAKPDKLLSYQSVYEITLDKQRDIKNTFGQPYIKDANGELLIDWFDDCSAWVSNQRMYISFINSSGIGTISDINYSLNENYENLEMNFALQVKENNIVVEQFRGSGKKKKNVTINLLSPTEKSMVFPKDTLFPHEHLKSLIAKLGKKTGIYSNKVYEGTIPNNYMNISTFFNNNSIIEDLPTLPKEVINKFWKIRMTYYKEDNQTPEMELTANINKQGVVSFFKYDYPEYTIIARLKKLQISRNICK